MTAGTWSEVTRLADGLRGAYLVELERFGEQLRPRFEAGELRAMVGADEAVPWAEAPHGKVEAAVRAHFGLMVTKEDLEDGSTRRHGNTIAAALVLTASPHAEATDGDGFYHLADHATEAAAWDVIALARERGWYTPTEEECEDPNTRTETGTDLRPAAERRPLP